MQISENRARTFLLHLKSQRGYVLSQYKEGRSSSACYLQLTVCAAMENMMKWVLGYKANEPEFIYFMSTDFVLRLLNIKKDSIDPEKLLQLHVWNTVVSQKFKESAINVMYDRAIGNQIYAAIIHHTYNLVLDMPLVQSELMIDLLMLQLKSPDVQRRLQQGFYKNPNSIRSWVGEEVAYFVSSYDQFESYYKTSLNSIAQLQDQVAKVASHKDDLTLRKSAEFSTVLKANSQQLINVCMKSKQKKITVDQAGVAEARVQDQIKEATSQFVSYLKPRHPRVVSYVVRAFQAVAWWASATFGLAARASAYWKKEYYQKGEPTYRGALAKSAGFFAGRPLNHLSGKRSRTIKCGA
jgi:hypothetical protein